MLKALVMRIAIPQWQGRIAPVFDVAGHLLLIDVEENRETRREEQQLVKTELPARAAELLGYNADVLICGAISAPLQFRIAASGVRVIAFVCGAVDDVLTAYLTGVLASQAFAMPGCRRWRQRGGEDVLPVEFGMGPGRGRFGQGRGPHGEFFVRGAKGRGMAQSPAASRGSRSALIEFSVCPGCGEIVRRKRGPGQARNVCSRCGAPTGPF